MIKKDVGLIRSKKHAIFRVWAPFAKEVSVGGSFNDWAKAPLKSENDGYWSVEIEGVEPGQEYKYFIKTNDGRELTRNDPRALHVTMDRGNSVVVDPYFDWQDDNFKSRPINEQVVYELHIGTFCRSDPASSGTFKDAATKLDYLADLGVTTIELLPVNTMSDDRGAGYAPDYLYAIESLYGGRREMLEFVRAAHSRGIGVVLDVVYNHLGPGSGLDMWQFDGWSENNLGGIYFYNDWRAQTAWGHTRLDYGRPEVRQYILDNVRMWLHDFRLDGLRVDSTAFIRNVLGYNNDPSHDIADGWAILQKINTLAKKINPGALIVAEDTSGNDYITKPVADGGAGFDAQWELNLPAVLRGILDAINDPDRNLSELCFALSRNYNGDAYDRVIYFDSHDTVATEGRLSEQIAPGHAHSQYARRRTIMASALILTAPGVPMLFQGNEMMQGGKLNDWQALDWTRADKFAPVVLAHKHMIALRKNQHGNTRGLVGQSFAVLHLNEESKILAYHRWDQGGPGDDVIAIFNFANKVQKDYWINFPRPGVWRVRFNSDWKGYGADFKNVSKDEVLVEDGRGAINIGSYSVLILSQD